MTDKKAEIPSDSTDKKTDETQGDPQSLSSNQRRELDEALEKIRSRNEHNQPQSEENSSIKAASTLSNESSTVETGIEPNSDGIATDPGDNSISSIDTDDNSSVVPPWMANEVPIDLYAQYDTGEEHESSEYDPAYYGTHDSYVEFTSNVSDPITHEELSDTPKPHFDITNEGDHIVELDSEETLHSENKDAPDEPDLTESLEQETIETIEDLESQTKVDSSGNPEMDSEGIVLDDATNDTGSIVFDDESPDLEAAIEEMNNKIHQQDLLNPDIQEDKPQREKVSPIEFGSVPQSEYAGTGNPTAGNSPVTNQKYSPMTAPMVSGGLQIPSFGSLGTRFNNYLNQKLAPGKQPDFNTFFTKKLDHELQMHQDNCRDNESILEKIVELSKAPDFNENTEKQVSELVDEYTQSKDKIDQTTDQFNRMASGMPEYQGKLNNVNKTFAGNINSLSNQLEQNSKHTNSEALRQMLDTLFKQIRQFFNKIMGREQSTSPVKSAAMG